MLHLQAYEHFHDRKALGRNYDHLYKRFFIDNGYFLLIS